MSSVPCLQRATARRSATYGFALLAAAALLNGCAINPPPAQISATAPSQWFAPLPHGGTQADLTQWWSQWNDPLLVELVDAAQGASPTLASARSRVAQAQATRTAAGAALVPSLDGTASISRGPSQVGGALPVLATSAHLKR